MPDARTKAQMDADDALELAIQAVANAYEMPNTGEGHILGEFLIIATWPSIEGDNSTYHWWCNGRSLPRHHIVGLQTMLKSMLRLEFETTEDDD